ncbi:hypothetical protein V8F20_002885 [Naviculisporaceae sp. PSN 640]
MIPKRFIPFLLPTATTATCSRGTLAQAAQDYVSSLSTTTPGQIPNLADPFSYLENHNTLETLTSGRLANIVPLHVEHTIALLDEQDCSSYVEVVSSNSVIGTQTRHHSPEAQDDPEKMYLIDSIVSTAGDVGFDASKRLGYVKTENWGVILPETARDKREVIMDAADAYLNWWSNSTGASVEAGGPNAGAGNLVPWGKPCNRLEGSRYTGNGTADDSCTIQVGIDDDGSGRRVVRRNRRYVIDETVGAASVLWSGNLGGPDDNTPGRIRESYSHLFRLEAGKLRYVHSITVRSVYNVTSG